MALIQSGATADLLTIDPASKAARVTLYDALGNEVSKPPDGSYMAAINLRQAGATAVPAMVWAMRAGASKTCFIRRIYALQSFDGTALAASGTLRYEVVRFSGANPTGGTALTIVKKRSSYAASNVQDIRFLETGLGVTGISVENAALVLGLPVVSVQVAAPATSASAGPVFLHDIVFEAPGQRYGTFELAPNEGLAIRIVSVTTIVGSGLYGFVEWDER